MGDTADQVIAPVWKIYPAISHAGQYIINSRYCGDLLWQSSLTLYSPEGVSTRIDLSWDQIAP